MTDEQRQNATDWLTQKALAALLGISPQTASSWAKSQRLRRFEHGIESAGRRRYSRLLVEREVEQCLDAAKKRQDELLRLDQDAPAPK